MSRLFGVLLLLLAFPIPANAQLALIEGRSLETFHGFMVVIPPGITACRGGMVDHGFLLFLEPGAPCIRSTDIPEKDIPWSVGGAPGGSPPHIHFTYSWNSLPYPNSAYELMEKDCLGGKLGVSPVRLLGNPGIECVRRDSISHRIVVTTRFHVFDIDPVQPYTDDEGYITPESHVLVTLETTAAQYKKHRIMFRRVFDAISWPSAPPK